MHLRGFVPGLCLLSGLAGAVSGQTFEVATIKASTAAPERGGPPPIDPSPGRLTMRGVGLHQAICWAYKIPPMLVSNPQMLANDRYDILATAGRPAKTEEMRVMLQSLLAERFKLTMHREAKEIQAYALVEAKEGHKLVESKEADGLGVTPMTAKMGLSARHATLDLLTMFISQPLRTPVIDMTGLKGRYDFEFDISSFISNSRDQADGPPPDPEFVLQSLLPKQLGLRLEKKKLPVEMLVIDRVEKTPSEN
jgi:uncharacterized protein (TIGR03435 family)